MLRVRWMAAAVIVFVSMSCSGTTKSLENALESITADELRTHLSFLAADEFRGRNTPSPELKIASRYLATLAESYGLKPLLPDGSFLQEIPLEVTSLDPGNSQMRLKGGFGTKSYAFPQDFGISSRLYADARISGGLHFVGFGLSAPDLDWDDIRPAAVKDKILVMLDVALPDGHRLNTEDNRRRLRRRSWSLATSGAAAVLSVVSEEREGNFQEKQVTFNTTPSCRLADVKAPPVKPSRRSPFIRAEIRHAVAADILGISREDLLTMFAAVKRGEQVPPRDIPGKRLEITLEAVTRPDVTHNVVAWLEGRDEKLKEEYVLFGSHHDHIGSGENCIFNGADDNGSGTVAMLEIAQALVWHRPKRSAILVWHTAEEKGLWGARYFVEHSPVPVEKMSAELNMDMLCRNDPNSIYLIGSNKLSSELDAAIHAVNDRHFQMQLDYTYEDPAHPDRFFFRSDQYPYIQFGIPAVWFFCGTTEDYHQETDTVDRADFTKMEKVTRLVYLTAIEIGNKPEILKLDLHPEITTRGAHNLKIAWR